MENVIFYKSSRGYRDMQKQFNDKTEELRLLQVERNSTQESLGRGGFNDPELVLMIQTENNLKDQIEKIQKLLGASQIIEVTDETRNTSNVRIGSIVKLDIFNISSLIGYAEVWEIAGYNETLIEDKKLAYNSPIAKQILGASRGELLEEVLIEPNILDIQISEMFSSWSEVPKKFQIHK